MEFSTNLWILEEKHFREIYERVFLLVELIMSYANTKSLIIAFSSNQNTKSKNFPQLEYSREDKALAIL